MAARMQGLKVRMRVWPGRDPSRLRGKHRIAPAAIDVRCIARGSALTGATTGSSWVELGFSATDVWSNLCLPNVKLASGALTRPVGVVMWDEGTVADDAECWVRVCGVHPYANVDGTTDVAIGDELELGADKAVKRATAKAHFAGVALEARTDNSVGAARVLLLNPANLPLMVG